MKKQRMNLTTKYSWELDSLKKKLKEKAEKHEKWNNAAYRGNLKADAALFKLGSLKIVVLLEACHFNTNQTCNTQNSRGYGPASYDSNCQEL
jgi:hypothetical protein